jgi:hypothetical protein
VTDTAKCATRRRAANKLEDIETPRVTRPVAGHREPGVPLILNRMIGSPTANTPRPAALAYDTADGRSPGSRVVVFRRLPGPRESSGHLTEFSPLTVAGAAAELGASAPSLRSHLIPTGEPSLGRYSLTNACVNSLSLDRHKLMQKDRELFWQPDWRTRVPVQCESGRTTASPRQQTSSHSGQRTRSPSDAAFQAPSRLTRRPAAPEH